MTIFEVRTFEVPDPQSYERYNAAYKAPGYSHVHYVAIGYRPGQMVLTSRGGQQFQVVDYCGHTWAHSLYTSCLLKRDSFITHNAYGFIAQYPDFELEAWRLKDGILQWAPAGTAGNALREAYNAKFFERAEQL